MSDSRPFHNQATQAERREVLENTLLGRARADADLTSQGRYKRETATRIVGVPEYPAQPENSPWHDDPVPPEPPLPLVLPPLPNFVSNAATGARLLFDIPQ